MNTEDDPNASLVALIQRAWELEHRARQRDERVSNSIQALAVRQRIETLKRQLGESA